MHLIQFVAQSRRAACPLVARGIPLSTSCLAAVQVLVSRLVCLWVVMFKHCVFHAPTNSAKTFPLPASALMLCYIFFCTSLLYRPVVHLNVPCFSMVPVWMLTTKARLALRACCVISCLRSLRMTMLSTLSIPVNAAFACLRPYDGPVVRARLWTAADTHTPAPRACAATCSTHRKTPTDTGVYTHTAIGDRAREGRGELEVVLHVQSKVA